MVPIQFVNQFQRTLYVFSSAIVRNCITTTGKTARYNVHFYKWYVDSSKSKYYLYYYIYVHNLLNDGNFVIVIKKISFIVLLFW